MSVYKNVLLNENILPPRCGIFTLKNSYDFMRYSDYDFFMSDQCLFD